jgi:energy-coupling factor transporter ATP-binding protein EcfA2
MITKAALIALDEPFTGIDADALPKIRQYVCEKIENSDYVLITHDESDLESFPGTGFVLKG